MSIQEKTEKSNVRSPKSMENIKEEARGSIEELLNSSEIQDAYKKIDEIIDISKGINPDPIESVQEEEKEEAPSPEETNETQNEHSFDENKETGDEEDEQAPQNYEERNNEKPASLEDKLDYLRKRLKEEQKKKYSVEAQKLKLAKEKEELQIELENAYKGTLYHHSRNVYSEYERAKTARKIALENPNGTHEDFYNADDAYQNALIDLKEFQRIEAQEKHREQLLAQNNNSHNINPNNTYVQPQAPSADEQLKGTLIYDWIKSNPEIDPESPFFNEDLEKKVTNYVIGQNKYLEDQGRDNERLTDAYFRNIENFMNKAKNSRVNQNSSPNNMPKQQQSSIPIGGVASSKGSSNPVSVKKDKIQIKYTPEEETWIEQGYMTRESLAASKIEALTRKR